MAPCSAPCSRTLLALLLGVLAVAPPERARASLSATARVGDRVVDLPVTEGGLPDRGGGGLRAAPPGAAADRSADTTANVFSPVFASPHHTVRGGRRLADVGRCKGLFVATKAEDEAGSPDDFIMSSGVMSDNWNGQQVNMATADEDVREFYLWKKGKPLYFDNVTVFSANPQKSAKGAVIKPSLDPDGDDTIEAGLAVQGPVGDGDKSFTAHLRYGRCFRYGQPYLWITFEAWNVKKGKEAGYDLLDSCGISRSNCKGKVCLRFTVLWAKQCPPQRMPLKGLTVGTSPNAHDVAVNGAVLDEFDPSNPTYYILKDTLRSVFYVTLTRSGSSKGSSFTIGKPSVQGFADNQLIITQSGTAGRGIKLERGGDSGRLEINFQCKPGRPASEQRISVNLDICIADTEPADCTLQNSELVAAESVEFSFVKYCVKNPSHQFGFWLFVLSVVLSVGTCVFGCAYNYQVLGHRSIDILPGIDVLRAVIAAAHRTGLLRGCPCPCDGGAKYQTLGQIDEDDEAPDGLNDSSYSYQGAGTGGMGSTSKSATAKKKKKKQMEASRAAAGGGSVGGSNIDLPRRDHDGASRSKRRIVLDEDDPFADVPVDEDDMDAFYDEEDLDGLDDLDGGS